MSPIRGKGVYTKLLPYVTSQLPNAVETIFSGRIGEALEDDSFE